MLGARKPLLSDKFLRETFMIPPNVTPRDFQQAIKEFQTIVSPEWVFTDADDVALYRDAYTILRDQPDERQASAAVCPDTAEQVQAVVRVANRYKIPIYPISTGRDLGYGGSAPNYLGSVVLDLKRLNRILDVNVRNAYVLVEPGVSYFDLYRHFQENNIPLMIDVPDPGWGSLVGNALDHGAGYLLTSTRNHFDSHCGMEVVLANGELVRTGMGALPGSASWQEFKFGVGPWVDGIFSQSNFGVVTKMGFWLTPTPDAFFSGTIFAREREDLIPLIDTLNYVENTGAMNGMPFIVSPVYGGSTFVPRDPWVVEYVHHLGREATEEELQAFAGKNGIPYWALILKFYGVAGALKENWNYCKTLFAEKIPAARFEDGKLWKLPLKPEDIPFVHKPEFGIPSLENFSRGGRTASNPVPDWGHIWFAPIIPRSGEAIFAVNEVVGKILKEFDRVDSFRKVAFSTPNCYWNRSFMISYGFSVKRDPDYDRRTIECIRTLIRECAKHGWGDYRAAPVVQDQVMGVYSFNDHALLRLHETLKDAIDPNGIISAGRYGIWPKHLREGKQ
jgi:FAD/FMN-containing dehydrogenase